MSDPVVAKIVRKMYATELDPFEARDEAGRREFESCGWDGWEDLPPRLREDWRRVAAGEPLTAGLRWEVAPS